MAFTEGLCKALGPFSRWLGIDKFVALEKIKHRQLEVQARQDAIAQKNLYRCPETYAKYLLLCRKVSRVQSADIVRASWATTHEVMRLSLEAVDERHRRFGEIHASADPCEGLRRYLRENDVNTGNPH